VDVGIRPSSAHPELHVEKLSTRLLPQQPRLLEGEQPLGRRTILRISR
jgi:hypothetical protein